VLPNAIVSLIRDLVVNPSCAITFTNATAEDIAVIKKANVRMDDVRNIVE
jgi:hypothetical protein